MIETIATAELIVFIDAVVDAREEVGGVEACRNDARAHERAVVINRAESIVDRVDCGGRDRQHRRIIATRLFKVSKEECTVATQWTTEREAILRLRQKILGRSERVARVEALVAQKPVQAATPIVRT